MAKLKVATGFITLGSAVAEIRRGSLRARVNTARAKSVGDLVAQQDAIGIEYTAEVEVYSTAAAASPLMAKLGDTVTLVYNNQMAVPTAIFNGAAVVTAASDRQSVDDYEVQTLTLVSNGDPTTP